jgi:hypothetical protein
MQNIQARRPEDPDYSRVHRKPDGFTEYSRRQCPSRRAGRATPPVSSPSIHLTLKASQSLSHGWRRSKEAPSWWIVWVNDLPRSLDSGFLAGELNRLAAELTEGQFFGPCRADIVFDGWGPPAASPA